MAVRRVSQPTSVQVVREAEALATGALALFLVLSLLSYTPDVPRSNLGGPVGHALADTVLRALGLAAYLFPVALGWVTWTMHRREAVGLGGARLGGSALVVIGLAALAGVATGGRPTHLGRRLAGWIHRRGDAGSSRHARIASCCSRWRSRPASASRPACPW
jgi:hypothetical protein